MGSNLTGKVIKKIKFNKAKVVIYFSDTDKLTLLNETFTNFYLFVGKVLNKKEIKEIKENDELNAHLPYAIKTVTTSLITEKQLKDKLYKRGCSTIVINKIIKVLKQNDLINDDGFIQDYIEYANEKLYGEYKIKQYLRSKGVSDGKLNSLRFSHANETKKAKKLLTLLNKRYEKQSYQLRKAKIYNNLLSKGYPKDIALEVANQTPSDKNDDLIIDEVRVLMKRWLSRHVNDDEKDKYEGVFRYVKSHGYPTQYIRKVWDELNEFND